MAIQARGTLTDYYAIAFLNSVAATLIGCAVYFWLRVRFGYGDVENLLVGALYGLMYAIGARWGGQLTDRIGADRSLRWALAALAATLSVGWLSAHRAVPFVLMAFYGLVVAPTWTALEGAVLHVPSPMKVSRRVGLYNIVWSAANAAALLLSGVLIAWRADAVVWGAGLIHALALAGALRLGRRPRPSVAVPAAPDVRRPANGRRQLMTLSWIGNGLAYVLQWVFFALLPHLAERMHWSPSWSLWMTLAFFLTRCASFYIFWQWEGWHDRPGWSHAALWAAPLCLGSIYAWPTPALVLPLLATMGVAFGLTYYASIYYTLEAGDAKATQGGLHEAMIGLGACLGPLMGSAAVFATKSSTAGALLVVALVLVVNGVGTWAVRRFVPPD